MYNIQPVKMQSGWSLLTHRKAWEISIAIFQKMFTDSVFVLMYVLSICFAIKFYTNKKLTHWGNKSQWIILHVFCSFDCFFSQTLIKAATVVLVTASTKKRKVFLFRSNKCLARGKCHKQLIHHRAVTKILAFGTDIDKEQKQMMVETV